MRNLIQRHPVITLCILMGIGILFFFMAFLPMVEMKLTRRKLKKAAKEFIKQKFDDEEIHIGDFQVVEKDEKQDPQNNLKRYLTRISRREEVYWLLLEESSTGKITVTCLSDSAGNDEEPCCDNTPESSGDTHPRLYNLHLAALLSFLCTPIFGATLQLLNAVELKRQVTKSVIWLSGFIVLWILCVCLDSEWPQYIVLIIWYFCECLPFSAWRKKCLPSYRKRRWLPALWWGFYGNIVIYIPIVIIYLNSYGPPLLFLGASSEVPVKKFLIRARIEPLEQSIKQGGADPFMQNELDQYKYLLAILNRRNPEMMERLSGLTVDEMREEIFNSRQER